MRKRIYIAGQISKGNLARNVDQATHAFLLLAKAGFAPFAPQWSVYSSPCVLNDDGKTVTGFWTTYGNTDMSHEDWLNIDLPWVAASDAVLRLPGESSGADRETAYAESLGIPVFHCINAVFGFK